MQRARLASTSARRTAYLVVMMFCFVEAREVQMRDDVKARETTLLQQFNVMAERISSLESQNGDGMTASVDERPNLVQSLSESMN